MSDQQHSQTIIGDHISGDKFTGDKVAGNKVVTETYIARQVIVQGVEITDLEQLSPEVGDPPYKGLAYFTAADHEWFFGREKMTATLINRLHDGNFLTVVGDSGSGKSSLVRAGVIPVMTRDKILLDGTVPPLGEWRVETITPTAHPLVKLATTLFPDNHAQQASLQEEALQSNANALHDALATERKPGHKLLLFVDQFEELFTLCTDEEARQAFINNLLAAAQKNAGNKIVITLRADFYAQCLRYEGLRQVLKTSQEPLGAMSSQELTAAILEPAAKGKWQFQAGLVEDILDDVGEEPGRLPLLSHALLETWKRRHSRTLTLSGYEEAGKVKGAIAQTADTVYKALESDEQKRIARRIFIRLTELGAGTQDTRRRADRSELGDDAIVQKVIAKLSHPDARLITTSEGSVDVSHEALIREWPLLHGWLDTNRENLLIFRRLTNAAKTWDNEGKDPSYLYTGLRLGEAEQWAEDHDEDMSDLEREFLNASLEAQKQNQRNRRILQVGGAVIASILVMLMIGSFLINGQRNEAVTARNESATSESEARAAEAELLQLKVAIQASQLASAADAEIKQDPELALLLATTGLGINNQLDTQRNFYNAVSTPYRHTLYGHTDRVNSAIFNPDGDTILTASWDGTAKLWDMAGNEIASLDGHTGWVSTAVFNPDGDTILTASWDGTAKLWDMDGNELASLDGHTGAVRTAVFNPDGDMILTASNDGTAKLWDTAGNEITSLDGHTDEVKSAVFNPDGDTILTASLDGTAKLWDVAGNEIAFLDGHTDGVWSAVFNLDGDTILTAGGDSMAKLWDVEGNEIASFDGHTDGVYMAVFNPSGDIILTAGGDGTAKLWDMAGNEIASLDGHTDFVGTAIFNPDGDTILTASGDGTAKLWDVTGNEIASLDGHTDFVRIAIFNSNGDTILTASLDGTAKLWDVIGNEAASLDGHTDLVRTAVFNPAGNTILTASRDGTAKLWNLAGNEIASLDGHTGEVWSAVFNPAGDMILTASRDGTVKLWNLAGHEIASLDGHTDEVWSAVFNPNGDTILTASQDNTAKLWDLAGNEITSFDGHTDGVSMAVFNPDGDMIRTTSRDGTAKLWNLAGNEIAYTDEAWSAVFNPDGDTIRIISSTLGGTTKLGDVAGNEIASLDGHTGWVDSAIFSPVGDTILTASSGDDTAKLWNLAGNEIVSLDGHTDGIMSAVFNPVGNMVLTASSDGTAKLWHIYPTMQSKVAVAQERLLRGFTDAECARFFSDDRDSCPQTVEAVFALFDDDLATP